MHKNIIYILTCIIAVNANAQPYVDLLNSRYTQSVFNHNSATSFTHLYIGSDLPAQIKNNKLIVLSPFYEQWNIDSTSNKNYQPVVSSIAMAMSAILPLDKNHWSITATAIPRFNSQALNLHGSFQMGGALIATYKRSVNLKYKVGVYVNSEFFGLFVIPLAGIDWKINDKDYLFGILPGRLTYEHKLSNAFYTGATFRAITNSYRFSNNNYLRIDDNQTSIYLDWYATRHVVLNGELGYGILRKLRTGSIQHKPNTAGHKWDDGAIVKLCIAYRIRL